MITIGHCPARDGLPQMSYSNGFEHLEDANLWGTPLLTTPLPWNGGWIYHVGRDSLARFLGLGRESLAWLFGLGVGYEGRGGGDEVTWRRMGGT